MFIFPLVDVRAVIERGRIDAAANGGFRNPYNGLRPGEGQKPGLWLVGDEGVYLLPNGRLTEGQRPLVIYAEECDPKTNPDCWHTKRRHFGADDGIEFLDAAEPDGLMAAAPNATHLRIVMDDAALSLTLIRR